MKRFLVILAATSLLAACGGGSSSNNSTPAISVALSPSAQTSLDDGQTVAFTATVSNDSASKGVTWTMSSTGCSGSACGTFTNSTTSGATYNTPASVTSTLTVSITAASVADSSKSATSKVVLNPVPSITTSTLSSGTVGTAYSATLAATGGTGTLTWSLASGSSLPAGLTLTGAGKISGTPTAAATTNFTVKATDTASTPVSATAQLSITINNVAPSITTSSLSGGTVGVAYNQTLAASGGTEPYTWSVSVGALPSWAHLNTSSGAITGNPDAAATTTFTVMVTDANSQTATKQLGITIAAALAISTTSSPGGAVATAYSQTLAATGGTGTLTWSVASGYLPAGLSLSSAGVISGTPTAIGTSYFTVQVADSGTPQQVKTLPLSITVNGAVGGTLSITTTSLPAGTVGTPYTGAIIVTGGTPAYSYSISPSTLPAGLSLDTSSGQISGTPTASGTATLSVTVTDSTQPTALSAGPQSVSITINPAPAACSSSGNEAVLSGQYAFTLSGFNSTGFLAIAGSFTADGTGKISGGVADTNGILGPNTSSINATASSYAVGSDNRGCATIATSFGSFTTRFVLGSVASNVATKGNIIEFEPDTSSAYIASGQILQQNTGSFSGGISGSYVYGLTGWDIGASANIGTTGVLDASGGQFTNFEQAQNDGGAFTPPATSSMTGTYGTFDSTYGRATATFTSSHGESSGVLYMVSSSELILLQTSTDAPAQIGVVQQQTVPTGGFDNSSLSGNMVMYANGVNDSSSSGDAQIGLLSIPASGTVNVTVYDDAGNSNNNTPPGWESSLQTPLSLSCSYTVASNGWVSLSGSSQCLAGPVFVLTAANTAVLLEQQQTVAVGAVEPQANLTFSNTTLANTFFMGQLSVVSQNQEAEVDQATMGSGSGTSVGDFTSTTYQEIDDSNPISYTVNSDGTVSIVKNSVTIVPLIIINSHRFVMINNVGDSYPYLVISQQ